MRRALRALAPVAVLAASAPSYAGFDDPGHPPASMLAWATAVDVVVRGPVDAADPEGPIASFGDPAWALGPATLDSMDVVSLGDGGFVTLVFESGISDGPDDDFAVYENGFFSGPALFAEFAFVEVSSDGVNFARMPSETLRTDPVPSFGAVDPTDYDFAGDQPLGMGTGFDLAELADHPLVLGGFLDLADVGYVRVVDVIGDGSTLDAEGHAVWDPYPTAFATGGFDLEAVGVIHTAPEPAAAAMLGAGVCLLERLRRRRMRRSARRG